MITAVQNALNAIVGNATILKNPGGAGRIFELFVMTGIGRALQARSYHVWIRRSDGTRMRPADLDRRFVQPGGAPTGIAPKSLGSNNASSIIFCRRHPGPTWELLNGIQFKGRSTADHEIDLAIVPEAVAQALRGSTGGKPRGRPRVAIECKDVGTSGSIDEMRAFVARLYDLTLLRSHHPYLGITGPSQTIHPGSPSGPKHRPALTYRIENRRTLNIIARRTGFVSGAASLADYHVIETHGGIAVGSLAANQMMDAIADWIVNKAY